MRWTFWRRTAAALAVIVGVGVGASGAPASAKPVHTVNSTVHNADWWW